MGNNPGYQLLSPWERLGEGVWPKAKHKETPAPVNCKQLRKENPGTKKKPRPLSVASDEGRVSEVNMFLILQSQRVMEE